MTKITFVCHGNICRSPMAEFMMKDLVKKEGRESEFLISSCAVSTEEIGNPVYPPAKAELKKHGIACEGKRAQLLTEADGERYDLFLCMDESNLCRAKRILGERNAYKCRKLLEERDVADPWYTGNFERTYEDILKGIKKLL